MIITNESVLITGAGGFIGSHLAEALLRRGCHVRAFVHYNSKNNWGWLDALESPDNGRLEVLCGDVRDPYGVAEAVKDCSVVFHLAALIGIPFSYHSPETYVETNIKGTLNILQACRNQKVERVLVTSTSEVYGTAQYIPIDENHPYQGQSPYSATKIGADRIAESFYRSFGLPVVIVRPFNTYGPRQSARAVIPTIITQLLSGRAAIQLGSLDPTRDLNFVADTVGGFIAISEADETNGQEINIASGTEYSVRQVAEMLIEKINPKARLVEDQVRKRPADSEVMRLCGSNKKLIELTGWAPQYDLSRGLDETVKWFKDPRNLAGYKANLYNI